MKLNRSKKPYESGKIEFNLPQIRTFKLSNGLDVLFVEKKELPIIQLNMIIKGGSKNDPSNRKGLSHLTSMLIDEGAGNYNSLELDDAVETLGSVLNISTDSESNYISLLSLTENFDQSLDIFQSIITNPHLSSSDFLREQKKLITKITQTDDDPAYVATSALERRIFDKTPYAYPVLGYTEDVQGLSNQSVKEYFAENFTVDNSTLIAVGNIKFDILEEKLNLALADWKINKNTEPGSIEFPTGSKSTYLIHKDDTPQSEIRIGHITGSRKEKDFYAKSVLNMILGGQFSSRINLNLREDKGYTYGAHSSFNYNAAGGYFSVDSAVDSLNTGNALNEIIGELQRITNTVKESEVEFAKSYLVKRYPSMFETYSNIARNLTLLVIHSLPLDYFNNYIENIRNVSTGEVVEAAEKNIFPDELNILAVGSRDSVYEQLKELQYGTVIELDKRGGFIDRQGMN